MITATRREFNEWFHLVEAKRLSPREIVEVVPFYDDLYTENQRVDYQTYLAPPVIVLDTTNATIDLDNISDNAQVSQAVSLLRQRFGAICLVLVGHVSKASRKDVKLVSFVGAGSWEGDTQQAIYLVHEDDFRYLVMGKKRFETEITEYRVLSHCSTVEAVDRLGKAVEIKCYFGLPEATNEQEKEEAREQRLAEQKAATWSKAQSRVRDFVRDNPGQTQRDIVRGVKGRNENVADALSNLIEKGVIDATDNPKGQGSVHYLAMGTLGNTPG